MTRILVVVLLAGTALSQTGQMQQGLEYNAKKEWPKAQAVFASLTSQDPGNKEAWFYLGQALQEQGKPQDALKAFAQADGVGQTLANRLLFREARALAAIGQPDQSLATLDKLVAQGFSQSQALQSAAEFDGFKNDPRFVKLIQKIDDNLHPCEHDPRYRAFDFWVGEWEVRPTGQPDAVPQHSSIQRILGGCVIFENYSYANGAYEGKSFNIFDTNSGKWHQTYVDSTGTVHDWDGNVRDNVMYYVGANLSAQGGRTWDKITYFKLPNGHVRHLSETSTDGGKTWNAYFDGDYSPVGEKH